MNTPDSLPNFLNEMIEHPPPAGSGVHQWMFDVARNLHAHMPVPEIEHLLRSRLANCGRPVPDRELKAAIINSINYAWHPGRDIGKVTQGPPKPLLEKIEWTVLHGKRQGDLLNESILWFDFPKAEAWIDMLFPGDPLLCCGPTSWKFETKLRSEWRGHLGRQGLIVPSPMKERVGLTQTGKPSAHTKDNTGPRRFLVVEFDFSEMDKAGNETIYAPMIRRLAKQQITVADMCAALLFWLSSLRPMTMAVSSGGKSIHGWWYVNGFTDDKLQPFWRYALSLGADPKTWLPSQFIRMPDGTRDNGNPQPVLYFNPATLPDHE